MQSSYVSVSVLFSEPKIPQFWANFGNEITTIAVSVLFSEPKIPQSCCLFFLPCFCKCFSALQRAENSSITRRRGRRARRVRVSVLFSEPKIPQSLIKRLLRFVIIVSVLFSEPKIPQCDRMALIPDPVYSFSALQRAENSSIPNCAPFPFNAATGFSALQRAENSSILVASAIVRARRAFQCSSASRKFLNLHPLRTPTRTVGSFSALQRAENSSIG